MEKRLRQKGRPMFGTTLKMIALEFVNKCRWEHLAGVTLLKKRAMIGKSR
jgi:hypothetical protein